MAYYDLKKKPSLTTKEGEENTLYPSIVNQQTISTERLLNLVQQRCGLKDGVLAGALMEIMDTVSEFIRDGYRVELGEFGTFSGKIKASKLVAEKTDIRAGSIRFTGVNFRASKKFIMQSSGELMRSPKIAHRVSSDLLEEELERRLMRYIEEHGFITRSVYTRITGRLKKTAYGDLEKFVKKGVVVRKGVGNQIHYVKAKEESE